MVAVLRHWTGTTFSLVTVSLFFGVLQAVVAIVGYDSLKFFPERPAVQDRVLGYHVPVDDPRRPEFRPAAVLAYAGTANVNWVPFVTWGNAVAAGQSPWSPTRRISAATPGPGATCGGAPRWQILGAAFACILGAYGASATLGKVANVFDVVSGLTSGWLRLPAFLIVIGLDNWTINVLNLYTGGLSLSTSSNVLVGSGPR